MFTPTTLYKTIETTFYDLIDKVCTGSNATMIICAKFTEETIRRGLYSIAGDNNLSKNSILNMTHYMWNVTFDPDALHFE